LETAIRFEIIDESNALYRSICGTREADTNAHTDDGGVSNETRSDSGVRIGD